MFVPAPVSESARVAPAVFAGLEVVAIWNIHFGVVVPMPKRLFVLSQKKLESAPSVAGVPEVVVQKGM